MWYRYVLFCCTTHGFPKWIKSRIAAAYRYTLTHSRTGFPEQEVCLNSNVYLFVFFSVKLLSLCWCLLISLEVGKYSYCDGLCMYFSCRNARYKQKVVGKTAEANVFEAGEGNDYVL